MEVTALTRIFNCLGDETRLRMVALLLDGPLCVCHFQEILAISQVKSSRHLAYLREHGMVEVVKNANWRIYRLPDRPDPLLKAQIECLRECVATIPQIRQDLKARRGIESDIAASTACCL
jgi:DNA-binding transcriptional ArsR family regulator